MRVVEENSSTEKPESRPVTVQLLLTRTRGPNENGPGILHNCFRLALRYNDANDDS